MESKPQSGARRIRRNRTIYSCYICRKRKIKCDKVQPVCGNCQKSGDRCVFSEDAIEPTSHLQNLTGLLGAPYTGPPSSGHKRRKGSSTIDLDAPAPSIEDEGTSRHHSRLHSTASKENLEARLDKLTTIVERLSRGKSGSRSSGGRRSDEDFEVPDLGHSDPSSPSDIVEAGNLGHLSLQDSGRTRYVGNTYWAYVADELGELNQLLKDDVRYDKSRSQTPYKTINQRGKAMVDSSHSSDANPSMELIHRSSLLRAGDALNESRFASVDETLYDGLPNRRQCNILYRAFITGVHSIYALVHPPLLLQWYNEFWGWYETRHTTKKPYHSPNFIPLLYAVLHGGALSCPMKVIEENFEGASRMALAARMNDKVIQVLTLQSFLRSPNLAGLMAYIIVQTMSMKEEGVLISGLSFSLTLQVCESLGLHREPSKFGIPPQDAEMRRRVWWHVVWLDTLLFTTSGWPPLVFSEVYWDVEYVSELRDDLIGTLDGIKYANAVSQGYKMADRCDDPVYGAYSSLVSPVHILAQGKIMVSSVMRKVSKVLLGMKPIGPKDFMWCVEQLKPVQKDLEDRIARIPNPYAPGREEDLDMGRLPTQRDSLWQWYGLIPTDDLDREDLEMLRNAWIAFHGFARKWLKMLIDKAYCLLYKPFLRNSDRGIWTKVRDVVVHHAHGYLEDFLHLATHTEYQPFHWAWPGAHQPLHAMMVILVDLYEHPSSPQAATSRKLIDRTLEVTTLDGGITTQEDGIHVLREEGRAAWRLLRNLREKAWRKAGLDPDFLWAGSSGESGGSPEDEDGEGGDEEDDEAEADEDGDGEHDEDDGHDRGHKFERSRPAETSAGMGQPDMSGGMGPGGMGFQHDLWSEQWSTNSGNGFMGMNQYYPPAPTGLPTNLESSHGLSPGYSGFSGINTEGMPSMHHSYATSPQPPPPRQRQPSVSLQSVPFAASSPAQNPFAKEAGMQVGAGEFDESRFNWEEWDAVFGNFKSLSEDMYVDFGAILFVHGAWSTPSCFQPIIKELEHWGIDAICPQLPTCNASAIAADPDMDMYSDAKAVEDELERLVLHDDKNVVLVLHSYGGVPGSQAARKHLAFKSRNSTGKSGGIIGILFIAAFIVEPGTTLQDLNDGKPAPFVIEHANGTSTTRSPEETFFSDLDPEQAKYWADQMVPQLRMPHSTKLTHAGYMHHPVGYLICDGDTNASLQEIMMKGLRDMGVDVKELHCQAGHSPFVSRPGEVFEAIQSFVEAVSTQN